MNLILHGEGITPGHVEEARRIAGAGLPQAHGRLPGTAFLLPDADASTPARSAIDALCRSERLDAAWFERLPRLSDFGLLVMDMDSTLVTIETIDEIADFCGRKREVAAITEAAMRGEIPDYAESLRRRVALLAGLKTGALERVYQERMRLTQGAHAVVSAARAAGLRTLLVSGGFTFFTERLKAELELDFCRANMLGIANDALTGEVVGEIVDAAVKERAVVETCTQLGIAPRAAIVMGDGANDLRMMGVAGLSVAFHAKPVVRAQASVAFDHCGLDGLLRILE